MAYKRLFTSESVTEGHPDKLADQVSDAVLDALIKDDPYSRVAVETFAITGQIHIAGEVTTRTYVDIPRLAREVVREVGYTRSAIGFDAETCGVSVSIDEQSPDIALGVDRSQEARAGDDDEFERHRCWRSRDDVRVRVPRYRRADAAADRAGAQSNATSGRGAQERRHSVSAARR